MSNSGRCPPCWLSQTQPFMGLGQELTPTHQALGCGGKPGSRKICSHCQLSSCSLCSTVPVILPLVTPASFSASYRMIVFIYKSYSQMNQITHLYGQIDQHVFESFSKNVLCAYCVQGTGPVSVGDLKGEVGASWNLGLLKCNKYSQRIQMLSSPFMPLYRNAL